MKAKLSCRRWHAHTLHQNLFAAVWKELWLQEIVEPKRGYEVIYVRSLLPRSSNPSDTQDLLVPRANVVRRVRALSVLQVLPARTR
jgi:hypothetical protein